MNRYPKLPTGALVDGLEPPPWSLWENPELTDKYVEVMRELEKYGYEAVKK